MKGLLWAALAIVAPSMMYSLADNDPATPPVKLPVSAKAKRLPVKPTIPDADRNVDGRVFLERAAQMMTNEQLPVNDHGERPTVVSGNVLFRKGGMFMYCDSAHFYEMSSSLQAYGNVRMEQGDTLFVYADELDYDGETEFATFYGDGNRKVRLINRDVTLETYIFYYNLAENLGYYNNFGTITDVENQLSSLYGQYSPDTKEAEFTGSVVLKDIAKESFTLTTERLLYNTDTHIANLVTETTILTDSGTVYTSNGWYDTEDEVSELYDRSLVVSNGGSTLCGDTIYFNHILGYGEAWGDMVLTDSVHSCMLEGDYGYYYQEADSSMATGHARILEYSKGDTLYMHGDTVRTILDRIDSTHIMTASPKVRFWRIDVQGICDSLVFLERDSTMYMYRHPIVWNADRQVFGGLITVHFNDSAADRATLPDYGFMAEHIVDEFYDQMSGKEMIAYFNEEGVLRQLDVNGNVQIISLPMENDSSYNKIVQAESSFLKADFKDGELERMIMWPEVTGTVTPIYLARKSIYYLPGFQWYEKLRPVDKDDIFNIPPEMEALLKEPEPGLRRRKTSAPIAPAALPQKEPVNPDSSDNSDNPEGSDNPDTPDNPEDSGSSD